MLARILTKLIFKVSPSQTEKEEKAVVAKLVSVLFVAENRKNICANYVRNMSGMDLTNFELSPHQTLQVHYYAGSTYSVLDRVGKGLNAATGIVKFAPATKVTALRNELTPQGLVQIFHQPFGSKVGRIVKLEKYLGLSLSNIDVEEAFDFFFPGAWWPSCYFVGDTH